MSKVSHVKPDGRESGSDRISPTGLSGSISALHWITSSKPKQQTKKHHYDQ